MKLSPLFNHKGEVTFLKWHKRMLISISRRKFKTLLLFLIVFVLGTFVTIVQILGTAGDKIEETIKMQLGATVTVNNNYNKNFIYDKNYYENLSCLNSIYNEIEKHEDVMYASHHLVFYAFENDFLASSKSNSSQKNILQNEESNTSLALFGVNDKDITYDIVEGMIRINEGRTFTDEEMNGKENVILINDYNFDLIYENEEFKKIKVGDTVPFDLVILGNSYVYNEKKGIEEREILYSEKIDFKVVGKFENADNASKKCHDYDCVQQRAYVPNETVKRLINHYILLQEQYNPDWEDAYKNSDSPMVYGSYAPAFKLNNVDRIDNFMDELETKLSNLDLKYSIQSSTTEFDRISTSVLFFGEMTSMLKIGIVAILIILGLVLYIFVKERKHEIGIYLACGEYKYKILFQFVLEVLLVSILALNCSIFIGNAFANSYSREMIQNQLESMAIQYEEYYNSNTEFNPVTYNAGAEKFLISKIEIKLDLKTILSIYCIMTVVLILSSLLPLKMILKIDARKVMM